MPQWTLDRSLTSAAKGQELAVAIVACIHGGETVTLDFENVEVMTPSFANSFVMTLLHELPLEAVRSQCVMINRADWIVNTINVAALRYQRGIRLSSQPQPA